MILVDTSVIVACPVLPDFLIRGQAAALNLPHLTNDRRRLAVWPDVDFMFPETGSTEGTSAKTK